MKKLFSLAVLIGCLVLFTSTTTAAQDQVQNNTACAFVVKVAYGLPGLCTPVLGFAQTVVAPFNPATIPMPSGMVIIYAKGAYVSPGGLSCPFYIGQICTIYPLVDNVTCSAPCGNYTAELVPGFGILLQ